MQLWKCRHGTCWCESFWLINLTSNNKILSWIEWKLKHWHFRKVKILGIEFRWEALQRLCWNGIHQGWRNKIVHFAIAKEVSTKLSTNHSVYQFYVNETSHIWSKITHRDMKWYYTQSASQLIAEGIKAWITCKKVA